MDRAVSDVLGYILVFALIMSSVALVTVGGFNSLDSVREAERFENAQRVFEVLNQNVGAHLESGTSSRATEIRLADARIGFGNPVQLNATIVGVGYNRTSLDPLVYTQSTDRRIWYSGGATIREERGYRVMQNGPPLRFGNRTVLTLVETRARDSGISGSGRVLLRSELSGRTVHTYTGAEEYTVVYNVTTDRPAIWDRWLEAETGTDCEVFDETVSCTVTAKDVYVRTVTIDLFIQ